MCHAAGGKESGSGVMNKKEFAYPISVSFWIWLELTVVRLCLSLVFTNASLTAEGQNQLLFCLQGLSFFRETLQWLFFKPFSFQLRQRIPFFRGFFTGWGDSNRETDRFINSLEKQSLCVSGSLKSNSFQWLFSLWTLNLSFHYTGNGKPLIFPGYSFPLFFNPQIPSGFMPLGTWCWSFSRR